MRFTEIPEGMTATKIETIYIRNRSETGGIYFSVNSGPLYNQIKEKYWVSENDRISLMRGLLDILVWNSTICMAMY